MPSVVLSLSSDRAVANNNTFSDISWGAADESGGTFWSGGAPTRITIPSALNGEVVEFFYTGISDLAEAGNGDITVRLKKNGSNIGAILVTNAEEASFAIAFGQQTVATNDYFEIEIKQANGTGSKSLDADYTFFSMATMDRIGGVIARMTSDQDNTTESPEALQFNSIVYDSAGVYNPSTYILTVPSGVSHILASVNTFTTGTGVSDTHVELQVEGTAVRKVIRSDDFYLNGHPWGVVAVSEGNEIQFVRTDGFAGMGDFDADYCQFNIEYIDSGEGDALLEGDAQSGADKILLEGDEQSGTDILILEGNF